MQHVPLFFIGNSIVYLTFCSIRKDPSQQVSLNEEIFHNVPKTKRRPFGRPLDFPRDLHLVKPKLAHGSTTSLIVLNLEVMWPF